MRRLAIQVSISDWSEQFLRIARHRVHAGDYRQRTAQVVDRVWEEIEKLVKRQYQTRDQPAVERRHAVRRDTDRIYLASGFQTQGDGGAAGPAQPKPEGPELPNVEVAGPVVGTL